MKEKRNSAVHHVNHAEIGLFMLRVRTEDDPAIVRAREAWRRWQRELFILGILKALSEAELEEAA